MSDYRDKNDEILQRGVAQSGSAPGLGPGGRRFESCRPDKQKRLFLFRRAFFAYWYARHELILMGASP